MKRAVFSLALLLGTAAAFAATEIVTVRPKESDEVLVNPGIGFTTFQHFNGDRHWKNQGWDIDHIIDESLRWHISSFNAKSSAVPPEWWPQVNRWLKRMGYRFVLRKLTYPSVVKPGGEMGFTSWWENKGVAPEVSLPGDTAD